MPEDKPNGIQADPQEPETTWMSDVQRALALLIVGTIVFSAAALIIRMVISSDIPAIIDLAKGTLSNLTNMALIALGFFFGNTMAKMAQDAGQQKVVEKLTSTAPAGPPGPIAPIQAPTVIIAWWSLLTSAEQAAIVAAAPTDPKAAAFMAAAQTGKASQTDLDDLVAKGLLTQARADILKAT